MKHNHIRIAKAVTGLLATLISLVAPLLATAADQKILYTFQGGIDGAGPASSLIFDASGNLYGATTDGGTGGLGTVFELTPTSNGWSESVLYSFQGGADGDFSNSGLVMDGAGNLYGTTLFGGTGGCAGGCGTVFQLTPSAHGGSWTESILYSFQNGADGAYPNSGVILDKLGNLYGTTAHGGSFAACSNGCGTVFELSPVSGGWTRTTLYSFQGGILDGVAPQSGLTMDGSGNLYGATYSGGSANSLGTVYEVYQSNGGWAEKILYAFAGSGGNGRNPSSTLVFSSQGYLVGTAQGGHPNGCCGEVFALVPHSGGKWTQIVAFRFNTDDGEIDVPSGVGTPVFDAHGNLYGTGGGGQYNQGVAYRLKLGSHGVTEAYYSFCPRTGCGTGSDPLGGLILDSSGNLYGATATGGLGYGVVYEITP